MEQAFPEPLPAADRDLRLLEVVADALRIELRVEEHHQPRALERLEDVLARQHVRGRRRDAADVQAEVDQIRQPEVELGGQYRTDHQRRPEVGLFEDQHGRDRGGEERKRERLDLRKLPRQSSAAIAIAKTTLAGSEGWNWNGPSWSQRAAPSAECPLNPM